MLLHKGKFLNLYSEPIALPNGHELELEVIKGITAAAIVPFNDRQDELLLVRQYRPAVNEWFWEIPCGRIESSEDPLAAACRELEEETGYTAKNTEFLIKMNPCIGYSDEVIHIYKGIGITAGKQKLDDSEILKVHLLKKSEVLQMLKDKKIVDPKTVLGLMHTILI